MEACGGGTVVTNAVTQGTRMGRGSHGGRGSHFLREEGDGVIIIIRRWKMGNHVGREGRP